MIRVNLLPRRREAKKEGGNWWIPVLVVLGIAELGGILIFHAQEKKVLDAQIDSNKKIEAAIAEKQANLGKHDQVKKDLADFLAREDAITKLEAGRAGPAAMLIDLSRILSSSKNQSIDPAALERLRKDDALPNPSWDPHRLWLVSFSEIAHNVSILGVGKTNDDVAEFLRRMSISRYFTDVVLVKTEEKTDKETTGDMPAISFEMRAKVRY